MEESIKLPDDYSVITQSELDALWSKIREILKNTVKEAVFTSALYECELSERNRHVWHPIDIKNAKKNGLWDNGHKQVRIAFAVEVEQYFKRRQVIIYVKNG